MFLTLTTTDLIAQAITLVFNIARSVLLGQTLNPLWWGPWWGLGDSRGENCSDSDCGGTGTRASGQQLNKQEGFWCFNNQYGRILALAVMKRKIASYKRDLLHS